MSTANAAALLLVSLLALTGCPPTNSPPCADDRDCPDGRCRFGACGPVCFDDAECASGEQCAGGACVARPECTASSQCASGFSCTEGLCVCTADSACASNQTCREGRCVTSAACTQNTDCVGGRRCEVTQGLCLPACTLPLDCAPGVDETLANALFFCQAGDCLRRCVGDATCGEGLICRDGFCAAAQCATFAECPSGQYCTSATNGRCQEFTACTGSGACEANFECRPFAPAECPPGFPCERSICQELPRCLIDSDCALASPGNPTYCEAGHCQQTISCSGAGGCPTGLDCVSGLCVPGGCRGHADCPLGQRCTDGTCRTAPPANDIRTLIVTPGAALLVAGDSLQLELIAFRFDGSSFPLLTASWQVLDGMGQPSTAVTVTDGGRVTAVSEGSVQILGSVEGSSAPAAQVSLRVIPPLAEGRRVVVIDASTERPLPGVEVLGCDAPPSGAPCAAPVSATTDANGIAAFPTFASATSDFSAASSELRSDGLPRYGIVSIAATPARDVLLPLSENPVAAAAGFTASLAFTQTHSSGDTWLGFAALSLSDPLSADLRRLLGETFIATLPGTGQRFPLPGSVVAYRSTAFGFADEIKGRAYALSGPGRKMAVAFGGKTELSRLLEVRSTELLAYAGALDFALEPPFPVGQRPLVPDTLDLDGDGLCADPAVCPNGTELLPDYNALPSRGFTPNREQKRRTELVIANLPPSLDTAVLTAVETTGEAGLVPLGFSSRVAGQPLEDGTRPVEPVVLRSGAPYAGAEAGQPGIFALALQGTSQRPDGRGNVSGRLTRSAELPLRVVLPPFLPLATGSTYASAARTLTTAQPAWNALASAGATLGRVTVTGSSTRHVVWFPLSGSQTGLRLPEAPASSAAVDPASEMLAEVEIAAMELSAGMTAEEAVDATGPHLNRLATFVAGYSRLIPE